MWYNYKLSYHWFSRAILEKVLKENKNHISIQTRPHNIYTNTKQCQAAVYRIVLSDRVYNFSCKIIANSEVIISFTMISIHVKCAIDTIQSGSVKNLRHLQLYTL